MRAYPESPTTFRDFAAMFPDDDACIDYLARWRWPDGFRCPRCSDKRATRLQTRALWQCHGCRHQTSVTAGTVLHRTKLPLSTWLYALWLLGRRKNSVSALQLQKETGIGSYRSAWALLHKVRLVLGESADHPLRAGKVEIDESILPGVGGRARHIGRNGAWIVAAIERIPATRRGRRVEVAGSARVAAVASSSKAGLRPFLEKHVAADALVVTDGHQAYPPLLAERGTPHERWSTWSDHALTDRHLGQVHLLFSNIKAWLTGTFHGVSAKYLDRYLAEYVYRFNRRGRDPNTFGFLVRRLVTRPWTSEKRMRPAEASA